MIAPWAQTPAEVLRSLAVARATGLDEAEVRRRRRQHGRNLLRQARRRSAWRVLAGQFESLVVLLLAMAAAVSFQFGHWTEGVTIVVVLAINTAIGFGTELKAVRSMESLRRMARATTRVKRAGAVAEVPASDLVPGDIVLLEGGDVVPADLRLIETSRLSCDESLLTGESVPVQKLSGPLGGEPPLAERVNMAFSGTAVTRGSAEGVVVATGMATEIGRIAALVEEAGEEVSPLEKRLDRLSHRLIWVTLALVAIVAGAGVAGGRDLLLMLETGIALAVAAIPEGLPIVATVALARGMWRMARRNVLIRRLPAVETLGATTVIFTDKTGTLTENRMSVTRLALPSGDIRVGQERPGAGAAPFTRDGVPVDPRADELLRQALVVCVLCSNAVLPGAEAKWPGRGAVGDPMEIALLVAGARADLDRDVLLAKLPEVREEAFDPDLKMMATVHACDGAYLVAVKGAPEAVLARASWIGRAESPEVLAEPARREWLDRAARLGSDGLRVLALATKRVDDAGARAFDDLVFLGLVGLLDPPRADVADAIRACRRAGIRVVMVTGDHAATARNVAAAVGVIDDGPATVVEGGDLRPSARERPLHASVFARVSPREKLELIALHQASGAVVAMTGDGVNDAPALEKADIGIAMGLRGSQVAREAADVVLRDDAFASIVTAIEQGRIIFGNIRKFVLYLLSCNLSEILLVSLAAAGGLPMPILPLQILYLNLVTDIFPAFALGVGEGSEGTMRRPPRHPGEPVLAGRHWLAIAAYGILITVVTLTAFALALDTLGLDATQAVAVSFLTLAFAQLWHVFNMRDRHSGFLRNDVTRNPFVWAALALSVALIAAAVTVPWLGAILRLSSPGPAAWLVVLALSGVPWAVGQVAVQWGRAERPPR